MVVIVLSIVIEVSVQVYDLISIMEVIPYLILSIGSIIIYIRSGKSLAASYLYHSSVHLVIFITTMVEKFFSNEYEHSQETSKHSQLNNEFASKRIVKRDFWLIPGYLIINIVLPLILTIVVMITIVAITGQTSQDPFIKQLMGINQIFVLLGQCLLLLLFYLMHRKSLIPLAIQRFKDLKKHIILIIVVLIAMYLAQIFIRKLNRIAT